MRRKLTSDDRFEAMTMALEKIEKALRDPLIEDLLAQLREMRQQLLCPRICDVKPGDVWFYPPNAGGKDGGIYTVKSVNKRKNEVRFIDDGWNGLSSMLGKPDEGPGSRNDVGWVLLGRVYKPGSKPKPKRKRRR